MHAQRTVCTTQLSRSTSSLVSCSGDVLVARVVPLVVDAVIGLALSLIAHVVVVVFVVAILHRIFCMGDILFTVSATEFSLVVVVSASVEFCTAKPPQYPGVVYAVSTQFS